jgi:hypothetical protein
MAPLRVNNKYSSFIHNHTLYLIPEFILVSFQYEVESSSPLSVHPDGWISFCGRPGKSSALAQGFYEHLHTFIIVKLKTGPS